MPRSSSDQKSDLGWQQRCFLAIEDVILARLVPHEHPGLIWCWIFKLPVFVYKAGAIHFPALHLRPINTPEGTAV